MRNSSTSALIMVGDNRAEQLDLKKRSEIYWRLSISRAKQVWLDFDDLLLVSSYLNGLDLWSKAWIFQILVFFIFKLNFDALPIEISS